MTRIIRDPLVFDNICEVDISLEGGADEARKQYEAGFLVLLRGRKLELDYDFLNSLNFNFEAPEPVLRKVKKYGGSKILGLKTDSSDPIDRAIFNNVFHQDGEILARFQEQVRTGNDQIVEIYKSVFPAYSDHRRVFTWRFTETLFENIHWDNFHIPEEFHQVRIFSNIDRSPRIWRISHRVDSYAESVYETQSLSRFAGQSGDDLVIHLNNEVLGGMTTPCMDRLPKHHVAFDQGDIWICETRIVSHQIYSGQRAVATMFFVDPATMDSPQSGFDERIRRLHERRRHASESTSRLLAGS